MDRSSAIGDSRWIQSNQQGPHERLLDIVARHQQHPFRKPIAAFNQAAFEQALQWRQQWPQAPLILDAGCGVGVSTRQLALQFPEHLVIGVDRSEDRLSRRLGALPENALLVRADLVDFWRLAKQAGWQPERQYVLYPNPYPKASQVKLRWHGHPVFPTMLALGGRLESRSNWPLYLEEMAQVLEFMGYGPVELLRLPEAQLATSPLTPFERKYHLSGQPLWQLCVNL